MRRCNQHVPNAVCSSHIHRPTQCGPHYDFTQHRVRSFPRHVQNNPTIHHQIIRTFGFPHVVKALSLQPGSPSSMACITCSTPLPSLSLVLLSFFLPEGQISSKFGTMWSPLHHKKGSKNLFQSRDRFIFSVNEMQWCKGSRLRLPFEYDLPRKIHELKERIGLYFKGRHCPPGVPKMPNSWTSLAFLSFVITRALRCQDIH